MQCCPHPKLLGQIQWRTDVGKRKQPELWVLWVGWQLSSSSHHLCPGPVGGLWEEISGLVRLVAWGMQAGSFWLVHPLIKGDTTFTMMIMMIKTSQKRMGHAQAYVLFQALRKARGSQTAKSYLLMQLWVTEGGKSSENNWLDANSHSSLSLLFIISISLKG